MDASAILANSTLRLVPNIRDSLSVNTYKSKYPELVEGQLTINNKAIRRGPIKRIVQKRAPREKINEQIRAFQIRVIDEAGNQLGLMTPAEALEIAREQDLDLVEIAPMAKPPVCKVMDYGKFQYQQSKQDSVNKAKQEKIDIKGIRIGVRTDDHDLEFKRKNAEKFLTKGDKVKIDIVLRGREKAHQDLARTNLENFLKLITVPYKVEQEIKRFPNGYNVILAPNQ